MAKRKKKIELEIPEGTPICECCGENPGVDRVDRFNQSTGNWCDECYDHHYPYLKDIEDNLDRGEVDY